MIRINCDVCGANIPQGQVAQMTLRKGDGQVLQMELCQECLKLFDNFVQETKQRVRRGKVENPL